MGLADATPLSGLPLPPLPAGPPYSCAALRSWSGAAFWLPPGDPVLGPLFHGEDVSGPDALDNLRGIARYWADHPDWMEFLDPSSPVWAAKQLERALYLRRWGDHLPAGARVLDLGGGVGRFAMWLLERGCAVELVDPDLRSLWRAVRSAGQLEAGRLDVHWSTGEHLPDLAPVDVAIAVEVLCYVADPVRVIDHLADRLVPGGRLLCSVEARYGWAMSADAADGSVGSFFSADGVVHVPGDRWVQTYTRERFEDLLSRRFEVEWIAPTHYALSGPFEQAAGELDLDAAIALEEQLAAHPVSAPLNRAWTAVARRRG